MPKKKRKERNKQAARAKAGRGGQPSLAEVLAVAMQVHQQGRLQEAEQLYRAMLEAAPAHPDALHFLGVLSHQLGRGDEAVRLIREAIAQLPEHPDMHNNLGNVLSELGRVAEAEEAYRAVLRLAPEHVDGLSNLGVVLREQGRLEEAEAAYARALELAPDNPKTLHNYGNLLRKQQRFDEAVAVYRRSIAVSPFDRQSYHKLARIYYAAERYEEAAAVYREWLEHDPKNPVALHMLAACSGHDVAERASDAYVQQTFDGFAGSFDKVLEGLEYRAPDLVVAAVAEALGAADGSLAILDAGSGTGLCGPLLRPFARQLVGVDLSPVMLAKAEGRGVYDELVTAELTAFLVAHPEAYDVIACADTLCYFGALESVITAMHGALRPGGQLVFTVERDAAEENAAGFRLHPHGRYSHTQAYVRRVLTATGFELGPIVEDVLRKESGEPVVGLVVSARRRP